METSPIDFNLLSTEQLAALSDAQKAVFQMLDEDDQHFFAETFTPADLPGALQRKGEIMLRSQTQRKRLAALEERLTRAAALSTGQITESNDINLGEIAAGAAAALGIGTAAHAIATDGSAAWKGVPPRLVANALERTFDNSETTDAEVEGSEESLAATIYLRPPDGSRYVPAITVMLSQSGENLEVKVSDLTSETWLETARQGGQRLLELAQKGLWLWLRRKSIFSMEGADLAQNTLDSAFDATQAVKNLNLNERVWQVIKETADAREKVYKDEQKREHQARQDLIEAWDDYQRCPRCGEAFGATETVCHICGRGRNAPPNQPDPRKTLL
jgi:hypothetical protein